MRMLFYCIMYYKYRVLKFHDIYFLEIFYFNEKKNIYIIFKSLYFHQLASEDFYKLVYYI